MDITTLIGVFLGFFLIILSVFIHQGFTGLKIFYNLEAFLVVLGGTFCATLINYPLSQVIGVFNVAKNVLLTKKSDTQYVISTILDLSQKARKDGLINLEADIQALKNNFMKRALQMVVDGQDQEMIRSVLYTEIDFIKSVTKLDRRYFGL
jgi:chemotaxis protein MotA